MYQFDIRSTTLTNIFSTLETESYATETIKWAEKITDLAEKNLAEIDKIIDKYSIDWDMDRISHIDKALLRIGISEINYTDTPYQVVVNEIIELSKEYSTEDSSKFINGILGKFIKETCSQG
jgi:N utilization substance protein B